jgi:hypothetical protein
VRIHRSLALSLGLVALAAPLRADDPTTLRMTGVNGVVSGGVYVGAYQGVLGSGPGAAAIDMFCVDYLNGSYIGQTAQVHQTSLATGADLSNTRIGGTSSLVINGTSYGALDRYRMAAMLSSQFAANPTSVWGNIHRAIWNITAGPEPNGVPDSGSSTWIGWVTNWYNTNGAAYDWSRYIVLSDASMTSGAPMTGGMQEFITTTPEPGTIILLGTGMLLLLVFVRTQGHA